jgi:hypothetical protein
MLYNCSPFHTPVLTEIRQLPEVLLHAQRKSVKERDVWLAGRIV